MKKAICKVEGLSNLSFGKYHSTPKKEKELHKDYELRTWRERIHYDKNGIVFIPGIFFVKALQSAAKFLGKPIPGKNKNLYTKHFLSGVIVPESYSLQIHKDKVTPEHLLVPSDGRTGGTTRVEKIFGIIETWETEVTFLILDDIITQDVFEETLIVAGQSVGIGRWRPLVGGTNGRFAVKSVKWIE